MVGTVGKLVVELCVTEVGSKSLGRSVGELLAKNARPIRMQQLARSENVTKCGGPKSVCRKCLGARFR